MECAMTARPRFGLTWCLIGAIPALLVAVPVLLAFAPAYAWAQPAERGGKNTCVDCHSDANFLVQNKKLYDYYRNWRQSVHRQENVTCADCHGGNPRAADKDGAHGGKSMSASDPASPISYQNVPATCANCHKDVYRNFQQSEHFKHLTKTPDAKQGPNCVTCHGSVNISVLNVGTVRQACERCHNSQTGNYPEIPAQAEEVLSRFLSINRYYRYIATQGDPRQVQGVFKTLDPRIKELNASWHRFDLDKVGKETRELIDQLKAQREEIGRKQAPKP
jgi:hypothetical protein